MRRTAAAALALAALVACKREAPAPAATPTAGPAATSPASATTAKLSWFEPQGDRCHWIAQQLPLGERTVLAHVTGTCDGARVAWSPDRTRALIWTDAILVETGPGGGTRPAPPVGTVRDIGYDASGVLTALTLEAIPAPQAKKGFAMAEGEKLVVPAVMDGLPVLARAYQWNASERAWKRIETKVSDDAWDLAIGVAALDAQKTLGERSWKTLAKTPAGRTATASEASALDSACPGKTPVAAGWIEIAPSTFARLEEGDVVVLLPPVCVLTEKGDATPLALDLDAEDSIAAQRSGNWILVSDSNGRRPHVVDLATRKTVWSAPAATEAVFWP